MPAPLSCLQAGLSAGRMGCKMLWVEERVLRSSQKCQGLEHSARLPSEVGMLVPVYFLYLLHSLYGVLGGR